tara:strand:- start:257 stop:1168 length:912 start_codon:yes stop_codon:yes gene_type:complete
MNQKNPYQSFNKKTYSDTDLQKKYKEYVNIEGYGTKINEQTGKAALNEASFCKIWKLRQNHGYSSDEISKRVSPGEGTCRRVIRFLEREESIIKDILAGKKVSSEISLDIGRTNIGNKQEQKDSFASGERASGSRTSLTNDQVLFFIENLSEMSFREIGKQILEQEGSLDSGKEQNINYILEKLKNLNDRLKGLYKLNQKVLVDPDKSIAKRINQAIKSGLIKYDKSGSENGRTLKTIYNYEEKSGPEKAKLIALKKAEAWLPKAKELKAKGYSSRKMAAELTSLGYKVGKTSILKYIDLKLL